MQRGPVREAGEDTVLIEREPRATRQKVAAAEDARPGLLQDGGGEGGPVHELVSIGRHHQRSFGTDAKEDGEEAHGPGYVRVISGGSGRGQPP